MSITGMKQEKYTEFVNRLNPESRISNKKSGIYVTLFYGPKSLASLPNAKILVSQMHN